jgi:hypothetical protein
MTRDGKKKCGNHPIRSSPLAGECFRLPGHEPSAALPDRSSPLAGEYLRLSGQAAAARPRHSVRSSPLAGEFFRLPGHATAAPSPPRRPILAACRRVLQATWPRRRPSPPLRPILAACRRVLQVNWPRRRPSPPPRLILAARRRVLQANWPRTPDGERTCRLLAFDACIYPTTTWKNSPSPFGAMSTSAGTRTTASRSPNSNFSRPRHSRRSIRNSTSWSCPPRKPRWACWSAYLLASRFPSPPAS